MQVTGPRNALFFVTCLRHNLLSRSLLITRKKCLILQFTKRNIMHSAETFDFSHYNCVGFDLDNTICRYKVSNLVKLEYESLAKFLINEKNYSAKALDRPIDLDFLLRGVLLDFDRGNILQVTDSGVIWKASHGTKFLSTSEIAAAYGEHQKWDVTSTFCKDPLSTWNGPMSKKIRGLLDYFDMPSALAFARIVDDIDQKNGGPLKEPYQIWPDILDGLIHMFDRSNFTTKDGGHYFNNLRSNPLDYVNRCTPETLEWLKQLKKTKKTFLITGSHIDFASFTATNCLGPDWRDLFDVVISFARKPFFFLGNNNDRPFLRLEGTEEREPITDVTSLKRDSISLSQGNWPELIKLLKTLLGGEEPHCLYIGDNVVQDLYAPAQYTRCHTIAVMEELWAEYGGHPDEKAIGSPLWDSYFGTAAAPSLWHGLLSRSSRLIVPNFETLVTLPLQGPIPAGYYPKPPPSHSN